MITEQPTEPANEVAATGAAAVQEHETAEGVIEHEDPKSGGSYVRDPDTGALTQTAGPGLDDQPSQE